MIGLVQAFTLASYFMYSTACGPNNNIKIYDTKKRMYIYSKLVRELSAIIFLRRCSYWIRQVCT